MKSTENDKDGGGAHAVQIASVKATEMIAAIRQRRFGRNFAVFDSSLQNVCSLSVVVVVVVGNSVETDDGRGVGYVTLLRRCRLLIPYSTHSNKHQTDAMYLCVETEHAITLLKNAYECGGIFERRPR